MTDALDTTRLPAVEGIMRGRLEVPAPVAGVAATRLRVAGCDRVAGAGVVPRVRVVAVRPSLARWS